MPSIPISSSASFTESNRDGWMIASIFFIHSPFQYVAFGYLRNCPVTLANAAEVRGGIMHERACLRQPYILHRMHQNFGNHAEFESAPFLFSVGVPKVLRVQSAAKRRTPSFLSSNVDEG